ncbi:MAG: FHA domain-containing protein [Clostridia bacterium]|nr:FHA domain-containing protein [Clostridia bacterium]
MFGILSKIISAIFILLVYYFIFIIVRMIYSDINVMKRKKAGLPEYEAYLKPINQPNGVHFDLEERYPLYGDETIGRGKDCEIYIADTFMSHRHSRIFKEDGGFFLEDLGSTNGTFLNGNEVAEEATELLDGDKICIGQVEFMFLCPKEAK